MKTFFTSDYHLNHANIIKYCKRPFKDVENMNEVLIRNHNSRVKEEDSVFYLGDFCFRNSSGGKKGEGLPQKADYFINQLNGNFIFVKGNHDRNNSLKTNIEKIVIRYAGQRICLVHNPKHADSKYELNIVGHVHEKWKFNQIKNCESYLLNVGVDVWGFKPVSFEEIMKEFRKWKKNHNLNTQQKNVENDSANG